MAGWGITKSYLTLYGLPWDLQPPDGLRFQYADLALLGSKSGQEKSRRQSQKRSQKSRFVAGSRGIWPQNSANKLFSNRWFPPWPPPTK
jgi:hypothetical protein